MKLESVKEFVEIAKEAGASELKYESGDAKISVKFVSDQPVVMHSAPAAMPMASAPAQAAPAAAAPVASSPSTDGLVEITSPFVGTFYRSSSPDSDPYVKQGDKVSKGQALCIVEAMKIMNEIESEATGEIVEVCVENETYVEFGQVLFRVKP